MIPVDRSAASTPREPMAPSQIIQGVIDQRVAGDAVGVVARLILCARWPMAALRPRVCAMEMDIYFTSVGAAPHDNALDLYISLDDRSPLCFQYDRKDFSSF
ncbi:hypothetical protein EVAR_32911_1 [Eumeta japonica]|uniref:Uncharacterized protein n=1 Tax=Eumeta variegata TaxID=151549 RepID=A0A4C2A2K1_EUMVA|nr:hypothetical protein EVAR_32911_1 [Eumeta japonica]